MQIIVNEIKIEVRSQDESDSDAKAAILYFLLMHAPVLVILVR